MSKERSIIMCGGKATKADLVQIARFAEFLRIKFEAEKDFGLSERDARRYAATEVYGDPNGEGDGLKAETGAGL